LFEASDEEMEDFQKIPEIVSTQKKPTIELFLQEFNEKVK
jgi:hypothetical protein